MYRAGIMLGPVVRDSSWVEEAESVLHAFQNRGLTHVELWIEAVPKIQQARRLIGIVDGSSVNIHAPFLHLSISTDLKGLRELSKRRLEAAVEFAQRLGASVVTCHAGPYPFFLNKERAWDNIASSLQRYEGMTSPVVALENMPQRSGTVLEPFATHEDLEALIARLPRLALTFDVGHWIQNGVDYGTLLETHFERVVNIHVHDGSRGGSAHLPIGSGDLRLSRLETILRERGYHGAAVLETIGLPDTVTSWAKWEQARKAWA